MPFRRERNVERNEERVCVICSSQTWHCCPSAHGFASVCAGAYILSITLRSFYIRKHPPPTSAVAMARVRASKFAPLKGPSDQSEPCSPLCVAPFYLVLVHLVAG